MSFDRLSALAIFALVGVITPGPNNPMLMASGANFGWQRSLPHMFGVGLGFPLMVLLVGLGVMQVFDLYPPAFVVLQIVSVAYLLYLAWKIAARVQSGDGSTFSRIAGIRSVALTLHWSQLNGITPANRRSGL